MKSLYRVFFGSQMRNRFTLFFIVLTIVPVLALGVMTLYIIDISHRFDVAALETQLIDQKIAEIQTFLSDTQGAIDLQVGFDQTDIIDPRQQIFLLEGILNDSKAFNEVRLVSLAGIVTARENKNDISTSTDRIAQDVSQLPEFTVAKDGTPYVGPVVTTLDGPMITLSMPVRNNKGVIIQVLSADVLLTELLDSMQQARLGQTGYLLVFDSNGRLILSPAASIPSGTDFSQRERIRSIQKGINLSGTDANDLYRSYIDQRAVFGAGKKVPGLNWIILAEWPVEDANNVIDELRLEVLALTLLSILSVLVVTPLFVSRLTKPIHELSDAARRIEEGDLDTRIDIHTGDELEALGEQFNTMAKGLRRLQELRNEFVYIVTHELRAPITSVKYAASMLREGSAGTLTPEIAKAVEPIWVSSEHLVKLVNDLLDVATSEAGKLSFNITEISLPTIIEEVVAELSVIAKERDIHIVYEKQDIPPIIADALRTKQVTMNFVSNAIKYNKDHGTVTISHELTSNQVVTHITDTGKGLAEDDLKHMFEKFYRSPSNDKKIMGTGLGLFITKDLIEKMDGHVSLSSTLGVGTTVTFSLTRAH